MRITINAAVKRHTTGAADRTDPRRVKSKIARDSLFEANQLTPITKALDTIAITVPIYHAHTYIYICTYAYMHAYLLTCKYEPAGSRIGYDRRL